MKKRMISLLLVMALVFSMTMYSLAVEKNHGAGDSSIVKNENAYDTFFSGEWKFISSTPEPTAIPESYPFIYGIDNGVALDNVNDKTIDTLHFGYLYLKNWKTKEITPFVETESTAFAVSSNGNLFVAERGNYVYSYTSDGQRDQLLFDISENSSNISHMVANNELVFCVAGGIVYRYSITEKILDRVGTISTTDPLYFSALSSTTVKWYERTFEKDPISDEEIILIKSKNFATGEIAVYHYEPIDCLDDCTDEEFSTKAASYYNDYGTSPCSSCHGINYSCNTDGSCECKLGSWSIYSGIQCLGYAYNWYKNAFGNSETGSTKLSALTFNEDESVALGQLSDLLIQCCYGAHIRTPNPHSLILLDPAISTGYMRITDANRAGRCKIDTTNFSYTTFISNYPVISWVWTRSHNLIYIPGMGNVCTTCGQVY